MKFIRTSPFGDLSEVHPIAHSGVDFAMPIGTPLRSVVNGVVEKVFDYGHANAGKGVVVGFDDGKRAIYGHMSEVDVHVGDKLNYGDLIGKSGNTGHSTGPHLHFAIKDGQTPINPKNYENDIQEICGTWKHADVGEVHDALGFEDVDTHLDIIDLVLGIIKCIIV